MTASQRQDRDATPTEALAFLWRGWRWIVASTVLATLLGAALAFGRGTTWKVQALLSVDRDAQDLLGAGTGFANGTQPRNYVNREAEVLKSVPVLSAALERDDVSQSRVLRAEDNRILWLKNNLEVEVGEEDGVLAVRLASTHPEDASTVVNAVVDAFRDHDLRMRGATAERALERLRGELEQTENEYGSYQAELSRFLDDHPHVATFDTLRNQRIALLTEVTPEHPAILDIDAKLSSMEEDVTTYESLRMRADRVRTLADTLYQRIREIDVNESVEQGPHGIDGAGTIRIWEYASPEAAAVASSRAALLLIAAFLGLMAGAGLAWVRSLVDDRMHTPAEVAARFDLVATVPETIPASTTTQVWREDPAFAGSMSTLRALLDGSFEDGAKVIQVTSAGLGEGKSLIAGGLGIAMAQSQRATLIIDAHLSAPGQAEAFGHGSSQGLVSVLRRESASIPNLIWETPIRNLYVLPAGSAASDALALLNDPRFAQLIRELRARFDRIIVDSAPVLGSAEAQLAATACDLSLVVLSAGETRARDAQEAVDSIGALKSRVKGVVLNRFPKLARTPRSAHATTLPSPSEPNTDSVSGPRLRVLPDARSAEPR